MLSGTFLAVISPEGWLDPEAHESDLRGSRGVALAGALLIFMGVGNFRNTVRPHSLLRRPRCAAQGNSVLGLPDSGRSCLLCGLKCCRTVFGNTSRDSPIARGCAPAAERKKLRQMGMSAGCDHPGKEEDQGAAGRSPICHAIQAILRN
jgi:hypothetical protein